MFTPQPADVHAAHRAGQLGILWHADGRRLEFESYTLTDDIFDDEPVHRSGLVDRWVAAIVVWSVDVGDTTVHQTARAWVRAADCGSGCRCAAELTFEHPVEMRMRELAHEQVGTT